MFKVADKTEKISENIITQIRDAILSGRLKPGDRLASEKELALQFSVSKATMREALRVLESTGLIEIRKGIGGGVFVAEVGMKTTINSIINFLHFKSVSIKDITMVRYIVEPEVAELAASLIKPEDIENLQAMIEEDYSGPRSNISLGISFHRYLVRMSENPILILIMDFIDNMLTDMKLQLNLGPEFYEKVAKSHRRILECLIRKDSVGVRREIIDDLVGVGKYMAELSGTPAFDPATTEGFGAPPQQVEGVKDPYENHGDLLSEKDLEGLFGKKGAARLREQGSLFRQIGTGELYLIRLEDKTK
jgi:GntR family transcriptional repressor for pyruvate dehydrogenase complex